jgi:hypothetical protein
VSGEHERVTIVLDVTDLIAQTRRERAETFERALNVVRATRAAVDKEPAPDDLVRGAAPASHAQQRQERRHGLPHLPRKNG